VVEMNDFSMSIAEYKRVCSNKGNLGSASDDRSYQRSLALDPYYAGLSLGDGNVKEASISGPDPEIIAWLRSAHIQDFNCDHPGRNSPVPSEGLLKNASYLRDKDLWHSSCVINADEDTRPAVIAGFSGFAPDSWLL
jgi:hypothetical protein